MTAVIGWNRDTDRFTVGQWLKGKIQDFDLSPNGKYWIYTAMSGTGSSSWTALARVPYLKALDFYRTNGYSFPVVRFISDKAYCFGYPIDKSEIVEHRKNSFHVLSEKPPNMDIFTVREIRNGWEPIIVDSKWQGVVKRINNHWSLRRELCREREQLVLKYFLKNAVGEMEIRMDDWEWADIDNGRILWSEKGLLMSGKVTRDGLTESTILYDTNSLTFTVIAAPY